MTFIPSRRQHARYTCKLPFKAQGTGARDASDGAILNIGMGGAFVRVRGTLKLKTVTLRVTLGEETMTLEARVIRSAGIDPRERDVTLYGIEFVRDNTTQGRLRLVVDRVRTAGPSGAPASMTNYWK